MKDSSHPSRSRIAVVGVSALFPGSLETTGFWRDILTGRDLIGDVPASHWLIEDYYDPDPSVPDKTYAKRGAFLDNIDFDAMAWGVPPNIVPETDTSQLLALIVAQRVLEDAARGAVDELDRSRISVILGVTSGQQLLGEMVSRLQRPVWLKALRESGIPEDEASAVCDRIAAHYSPWNENTFPGLLGNVVAGRIANRLDLGGTNCVTDAACASTFSALTMAVQELQLGDSDMVITGGVDAMNDIFMFMCFSKTPALSPTGDCRPFSDQADGTMLGEGLGMVALKRLEDAERDGDRIYAVINGVGSSSDGRSKSVYAPRSEGQTQALRRAYEKTGYGPDTVELVEAHGTGTVAGDTAEFRGLTVAFDESQRRDRQWCALGSVKSQIGHTKAAAGAAGLFKAVMALHHKVLPPTIKVERPNPALNLDESPFHLCTRARPWVRSSDHPRRASVSSFGFGGSNFHVALSEYEPGAGQGRRAARLLTLERHLILLGGADAADAVRGARELAARAAAAPTGFTAWCARDSQNRFQALLASGQTRARLAVLARDEAELATRLLEAAQAIESEPARDFALPTGCYYGTGNSAASEQTAFVFPGQGSQYLYMGAELAMHFGEASAVWDLAADADRDRETRTAAVVFPPTAFEEREAEARAARLAATEWAQPAIGTVSLSMLALLDRLGLRPAHTGGHSYGEITAMHAAGVLGLDEFLQVSRRRGELMAEAATTGGAMVAVAETIEAIGERLAAWDLDLVVANHNGPRQVVLSGAVGEIERAEAAMAAEGLAHRRLPVATAFHSSIVAGAGQAFAVFLEGIEFRAPSCKVYSNVSGAAHDSDPGTVRRALADQLSRPVRFVEMIESMYEAGARTFIEVGPASVTSGLVAGILGKRPHSAISLDRKGKNGLDSFMSALAALSAAGLALDFEALWSEYADVANPESTPRPKVAISINGSNYGTPYPPPGGATELPPPNPARAQTTAVAAPPAQPVLDSAEPSNAAWVAILQDAQRQTAEAHSVYLKTMADTHALFLQSMERNFSSQGMGTVPTQDAAALPPASAPAPASAQAPAFVQAAPTVAPSMPAGVAEPAAAPATVDLHALMMEVVSDKTGYPTEMLTLEMELESDLGIDSIKRVEILSAMTERAPGLPEVDTTVMARLATLGQVVDYMSEQSAAPAVARVVAATASVADVDLETLMLEVVSEKTGYPTEMLTLEMELEGDLGIDSIKRVEILSAMTDRAPGLPEVDTAVMAKLTTLGQVVDYMNEPLAGEPAGADVQGDVAKAAPSQTDAHSARELGRFVLDAVEKPACGLAQSGVYGQGRLLITSDGSSLASKLAETLGRRGIEAVAVTELPETNGSTPRGLIFLAGPADFRDIDAAVAVNRKAFQAARKLAPAIENAGPGEGLFVTVQDTGGAFGTTPFDEVRAWSAGPAALARTVAQEWPGVAVKAIDLERGARSDDELAEILAEELTAGGPDLDVGLGADGVRRVLQDKEVAVEAGTARLVAGDVVVCSGGARGVTAATMIGLAGSAGLRFALLGRSRLREDPECCRTVQGDAALKKALLARARERGEKPTPAALGAEVATITASREIRATLAAIETAGSEARYLEVDVTDAAATARALVDLRSRWGQVAALVHGAGVLADKRISEKTVEQFDRVFNTKISGLRSLLEATATDPLKLICMFSSVAARCGNLGQCDYAMANEILNKVAVAESRRREGACLVRALGWGPWQGGMVGPQLRARFEAMGVALIPLGEGARMFVDECSSAQREQVELVLGDRPRPEALLDPSEGRTLSVDVMVGRSTHPYLGDHVIEGVPVVPVALAIEWFSRTARAFCPELELAGLREVNVLRGLSLHEFDRAPKKLVLKCCKADGGADADSTTLQLQLGDGNGTTYYRCCADLATHRKTPEIPLLTEAGLSFEAWNGDPMYDGEVLFHGPDFQMLQRIDGISDHGVVADLTGVLEPGWASAAVEPWCTDPLIFDGGLQLALLWCRRVLGGASLPTGIAQVRTFHDPSRGPFRCTLRGRSASGNKAVSDAVFHDANGRIVAELAGIETHLLPSRNGDRS